MQYDWGHQRVSKKAFNYELVQAPNKNKHGQTLLKI